ncbi:MAG TPA: hypothetical protein VHI71_07490 [Actinomycetota bacterium]|nr:hypothetical protein [Actinomycetota bacterium]
MRELFIEELAEVKGGADPLAWLKEWIRDHLVQPTTQACGEESPIDPPWC